MNTAPCHDLPMLSYLWKLKIFHRTQQDEFAILADNKELSRVFEEDKEFKFQLKKELNGEVRKIEVTIQFEKENGNHMIELDGQPLGRKQKEFTELFAVWRLRVGGQDTVVSYGKLCKRLYINGEKTDVDQDGSCQYWGRTFQLVMNQETKTMDLMMDGARIAQHQLECGNLSFSSF